MNDYFPAKLALGEQFCNRAHEKHYLQENIRRARHTVLIAPRRYGKSSLALQTVCEIKLPLASVDLFLAHDDNAVTKRILSGVSQAVSHLMPIEKKILTQLQSLFSKFRVSLSAHGFNIDAAMETGGFDPVDQIFTSLQSLANLARKQRKKLVFFIDEFQDIQESNNAKAIQGAIRHVAQESDHIVFIFSGSNRRLLLELFDDKSKPLYMLCDRLHLERMSSSDYHPHLQRLAHKKWKESLSPLVFEKIMSLTELHPYYVNLLCNEVWKNKRLPQIDDIYTSWQTCYELQEDRLISDLEKLTAKQQDVLKALALQPAIAPTGQQFVALTRMPISSVSQTLKSLLDKDMIYKVKKIDPLVPSLAVGQIRVLDPLLAYALKKFA
jgi:AAA+ ATPase superfamily predicted ATPase